MRNKVTQVRACKLRNQSTDAERQLWKYLRQRQLGGFRFRRQVPIGAYVADFACIDARLIIELDGGHHQTQHVQNTARDSRIRTAGYHVVRFWNNQIFEETTAVLEVILNELLKLRPHPSLPPHAGEGN